MYYHAEFKEQCSSLLGKTAFHKPSSKTLSQRDVQNNDKNKPDFLGR
jgi:hypothetical protein